MTGGRTYSQSMRSDEITVVLSPGGFHSQHTFYRTEDPDRPDFICDHNGDVVLDLCRTCGAGEIDAVETPCVDRDDPRHWSHGETR